MADRSVSVPMTLSYLESRDSRGQFFFRRISLPFYVDNDQIRQHNTCGAYFYGSLQPRPYRKRSLPQRSHSFGVPFSLCIQPLTQKFDVHGNYSGCMLGSATPSIPREQSSSAPQFGDSPVFMPTPFNAE